MLHEIECDHGWPPDECQQCRHSSFRHWLATVAERFRPGPGLEYLPPQPPPPVTPPEPRTAGTWHEWQQRAADAIEHKRRTRT